MNDEACEICDSTEAMNDDELYTCDYCGTFVCSDCMEDAGVKIYCSYSCENLDQS